MPALAAIDWAAVGQHTGLLAGWVVVALLCLAGLALSAVTLSGTWLVVAATVLAAWLNAAGFPGLFTILLFLVLAVAVELAEWLASLWGVQKRGGSPAAGWAALGGSLLGMMLGLPFTLLGSLVGMMLGGFLAAYLVEKRRLQAHDPALHIAMGTVMARLSVLLLKLGATLLMVAVLGFGLLLSAFAG